MKEQHGPIKEQQDSEQEQQSPTSKILRSAVREQQRNDSNGPNERLFGNYELVRRIDVGGMGEVYLARQRTAFGRPVAVKIIRSDLVHDTTARKRFLREAEVSAHLKHEHILPLFEFGEEQGRLFLVTPYIEGGTLAQRLRNGPLSLSEVYVLFSALVRAVVYIHKRGVIHRDLKPGNILLDTADETGQAYVRLIDFGIATIQRTGVIAPTKTLPEKEMGTATYMAPERLQGVAAPSNDIYSLGVILYQMLTGKLPDDAQMVPLPALLEAVVQRSIAPDPAERFATAEDLLKAFEYAYRSLSASLRVKDIPAEVPPAAPVLPDDVPTPKRITTERSVKSFVQESKSLQNSDSMPPLPPRRERAFNREDYEAPTSYIDPQNFTVKPKPPSDSTTGRITPPPKKKKRKSSLLGLIPLLAIVILVVVIGGMVAFAFQSAVMATVTLAPQLQTFSKVYTVTAKPSLKNNDADTASMPAGVVNVTKSGQKQGTTTGQKCNGFFNCKATVSDLDVSYLSYQVSQDLRNQIAQELKKQTQATGVVTVGDVVYTNPTTTAKPSVGSESNTVTVSVTQQGSIEVVRISDVQSFARVLLKQDVQKSMGDNVAMEDQYTQVGQPAIQSVSSTDGVVKMTIAAGTVVKSKLSSDALNALKAKIKGKKVNAARDLLKQQQGIDPGTVSVKVNYNDTLPTDAQRITINEIGSTTIPSVQLTPVSGTPVATQ